MNFFYHSLSYSTKWFFFTKKTLLWFLLPPNQKRSIVPQTRIYWKLFCKIKIFKLTEGKRLRQKFFFKQSLIFWLFPLIMRDKQFLYSTNKYNDFLATLRIGPNLFKPLRQLFSPLYWVVVVSWKKKIQVFTLF